MNYADKQLIVFDLDGTLTESKSPLTQDVGELFAELLSRKKVAIIGGGRWEQFQEQFLKEFKCSPELLGNLYLFPTTATTFYKYENGWQNVYSLSLTPKESEKIIAAIGEAIKDVGYVHQGEVYGKIIEDRGTQIAYSALGQDIVKVLGKRGIELKTAWGKLPWREKIAKALEKKLPDFEVHRGGLTTIDITRKGINKGYGLRQIEEYLRIPIKNMLFIGDAIFPGGNDYAVVETGVDYIKVDGPHQTKEIINLILQQ
jgi:phosphomannomutase